MKRSVSVLCGLLGAILALCVAAFGGSTASAKGTVDAAQTALPQPVLAPNLPLVVVRGLGPVDGDTLEAACQTLLQAYPVRCEVRSNRPMYALMTAWDEVREQLNARTSLDIIFENRERDALVEINVTGVDIFEPRKPYVFGLASLTDRVALISMARIDERGGDDQTATLDRLRKLVLHEAGHALGLHHHEHEGCVMRQDPTVDSLDSAPQHLCEACHGFLTEQARRLARPGQLQLDRARGFLVRGAPAQARRQMLLLTGRAPFDRDLYNAFGLAFFEARLFEDAIDVLKVVTELAPDYAEAHVNLGLAYQMRSSRGDRERAITAFQRALDLRPQWELVATHLQGLQSDRASAQGGGM